MANLEIEQYDGVEDRMIKVYPYEFIMSTHSEAFVKQNAVSLAAISQDQLDVDDELLLKGENGDKYFEMFAAVTSEGKLDVSTATSVYGLELKEEDSFRCISNYYYEGELKDIQMGQLRFMPAMFVIGEPYNQAKYEAGEQAVFIPTVMIEAVEGEAQHHLNDIDPEGLYEFTLVNISAIENQFGNVRIIPTEQVYSHPNFSQDVNVPKITLSMNNSALVNHVKLRARYKELPSQLQSVGMVDLYSMNKIAPIQFTPTSIQENLELYCDWFNYDNVMPWAYAQNFRDNVTGAHPKQLEMFITDSEDVKLINAMLYTTAAFADSFSRAPRYSETDAKNAAGITAGKIKADFKIMDLVGYAIEDKTPVKVVDGLYEKHIRDYPDFLLDRPRVQKVNMVLAALSRYIYSKHAIGQGQNSFNSLYLPWFLEPAEKIDYLSPRDKEITFNLKTNYYKKNFTDKRNFDYGEEFEMPERVNLTSQILLRSDRPTTLPMLTDTIRPISKLPLAGDIVTSSSQDLQTLFYVQVPDRDEMMKMFIDTASAIITPDKNETKQVPSFTYEGPSLTEAQAKVLILAKYPGGWAVQGNVALTSSTRTEPNIVHSSFVSEQPTYNPNNPNESNQVWRFPDGSTTTITTVFGRRNGPSKTVGTKQVTLWVIGASTIIRTATGNVTQYSIDERQLIFDKQEWQSFLERHAFTLNPDGLKMDFEHEYIEVLELEEISIGSIWADYVILKIGVMPDIRIPMFNKDDETIGIQRIIFT